MSKLSDNDIKKSIEWHLNSETHCGECSYIDVKKNEWKLCRKIVKRCP